MVAAFLAGCPKANPALLRVTPAVEAAAASFLSAPALPGSRRSHP